MATQTDEEFILHAAETTKASVQQLRNLLRKHNGDRKAALREAKKLKT